MNTEKELNVLSLFDGMSCGQIALERAGIPICNYYASEIKKHAIKCCLDNYPKTKHVGDITRLKIPKGTIIDLIIGGSPCQDISNLKPEGNLYGEKSKLFFEYVRLLKECKRYNPDIKFLLENVNGDKKSIDIISEILAVKPIRINSNLVSYQNRDRLYWTNIQNVTIPEDKNINFQDYILPENEYTQNFKVNKTPSRVLMYEKQCPNITYRKKINCLTCKQDRRNNSGLIDFQDFCRYLTTVELEQAQNVPIGYTKSVSRTQAEDLLGDGWTIDVIAHIFKGLKK